MSSNYNSRLSDSSWRPSASPYGDDTDNMTPKDNGNNHRGGVNNRPSPSRSGDPTPNSLNETAHRAVHFSRAEYKAPNSLQNSMDDGNYNMNIAGGVSGVSGGGVADSREASRPGRSSDGSSPYRESKSYMDRYRDVKRMASPSPTRHNGSISGGGGVGSATPTQPQRSRSAGRTPRSASRGGEERGAPAERYSPELRGYDDDNMSERTPLERWESRKERKMMEQQQRGHQLSPDNRGNIMSDARMPSRAVTPTRTTPPRDSATRGSSALERAREVTRDRATRWSPREEDRYADDEVNGYEGRDGFGVTTTSTDRNSNQSRSSSRQDDRRERSADRYGSRERSSEGYDRSERSMGRERSSDITSHGSSSRSSRSNSRSGRYKEELRRHEIERPDPLGRRDSSLSEFKGQRTRDANKHNTSANEGNGSPLFDDMDEEGAGNFHVGDRSPLALDNHFDDRQQQKRSPQRSTPIRSTPGRSAPLRSSPNKPSPSRSNNKPTASRSTPKRSTQSSSQANGNSGGSSRRKKKSTYVDDLASFTESITGSVVGSVMSLSPREPDHHQQQQSPRGPPAIIRSHAGAQYNEMPISAGQQQQQQAAAVTSHNGAQYNEMQMEEGVGNAAGVPVIQQHNQQGAPALSQNHSPRRGTPAAPHVRLSRAADHGGIDQDVRVTTDKANPRRASEFCERFTGIRPSGYSRNSYSALTKSKKKYICITVVVCTLCILAAGLAIYFIGEKQDAEKKDGGGRWGGTEEGERGKGVGLDGWDSWVTSTEPSVSPAPTPGPSGTPTTTPTKTPTVRPTSARERSIGTFLAEVSDGESDKSETPQYAAKMWIIHDDDIELHLPLDKEKLNDSWQSEIAQRIQQRYALATLYHAMGIGNGGVVKGWLKGDECREVGDYGTAWDGVGCGDDGRVRALALDGANLHGSIPHEISLLTSVENLIIKNNPGLIGKIPHTIGNQMTQLRQLGLYGNTLTGSVPKNLFRLSQLVYLNLADNTLMGKIHWEEISHHQKKLHRLILHNNLLEGSIDFHLLGKTPSIQLLGLSNNLFEGKIDDTVGSLTSLEYLYLDGNKLAGSIPDGIGNLANLKALNLDENDLYGTLPHTIGEMSSLEYLSAKGNTISGGFPMSTHLLKNLQTLNLASNAMSGSLRHLTAMSSLRNVHLYSNSFTGSIDGSTFTNLPNLEVLFLSSNALTGVIPREVASAQKRLKGLYLSDNKFNGDIPQEVCSLYKLENLYLDANNFDGILPTCLGNLSGLRRFYVFKNRFAGKVPSGLMNLPHLIELGIEENDVGGGLDQTCTPVLEKGLNIWADCAELDGGCECCEKCCSDRSKNC